MLNNMIATIGKTPLLKLERFAKAQEIKANIYAKCEFFNPTGSMKDRVALAMIEDAERNGRLKAGGTIIEPTSGNTGIGLAAIGAQKGYRVVIVMPETMSIERRKMMAIYGAKLVLTPGSLGMKGAIAKANELVLEYDNAIIAGQFINSANPMVHYQTTGPEIWEQSGGVVDALVAGVGTGGSITGVGKFLKEQKDDVVIVAVEPKKSPVLSGQVAGPHGIQGIGAGFIPEILDINVFGEIYQADEADAYEMVRSLATTEGLFCGISSGAALSAVVHWAKSNPDKEIVVILPDMGNRYLSNENMFSK